MVKQGLFSVRLVNAETMIPFQEHLGPGDGNVYVEVEPEAEYWIRVQSDYCKGVVRCSFEVDEKGLGFSRILCPGRYEPCDGGVWSRLGEHSKEQSLKVKSLYGWGRSLLYFGKVKVDFYEAIQKGERSEDSNFANPWRGREQRMPDLRVGFKAVVSDVGTKVKASKSCKCLFEAGCLLQSITLRYCTAKGLLYAGVLPRPSMWELHRMHFPAGYTKTTRATSNSTEPELIITFQGKSTTDGLAQATRSEYFDLTQLDDDEDK